MHYRHLITLVLVLLCVLTAIPLLLFASNRTEQAATTESADQKVAYSQPLTVGVILSGQADRFGWQDMNGAEYVETQIGDSRVILYDNLNATARPGFTCKMSSRRW